MRVALWFEEQPCVFEEPRQVLQASTPAELTATFNQIEEALDRGFYVAGFLSYECGYTLNGLPPRPSDFPLVCMGVFDRPRQVLSGAADSFRVSHIRHNISKESYFANIEAIRRYIASGEVYQITYCLKLLFDFDGSPFALFRRLLATQPVPYPAFVDTGKHQILSLSPELFVKKTGGNMIAKPMKGSWPCTGRPVSDWLASWRLHFSRKNRAENVMIADLLRNDLGRVGTHVRCPRLFEVTRYKTICQMTSTVTARVPEQMSLLSLMSAIFPSGSVTGAPKIRAMDIIRELEPEPRKIYTGAIGMITPERDMFFNVPIRTVLIDGHRGELGIGGGIVWDSTPQGEWDEGVWKSRFFTELTPDT